MRWKMVRWMKTMRELPNRIPINDCRHGYLYRLYSRNLNLGVYRQEDQGFVGIRLKLSKGVTCSPNSIGTPARRTAPLTRWNASRVVRSKTSPRAESTRQRSDTSTTKPFFNGSTSKPQSWESRPRVVRRDVQSVTPSPAGRNRRNSSNPSPTMPGAETTLTNPKVEVRIT